MELPGDLEHLVGRAQGGDMEALAEVTRRFQQMAFGYALSLLRDLHQAEDVVQEAPDPLTELTVSDQARRRRRRA